MDYERGLEQLKRLAYNTDRYQEFLIYENRLQENLSNERLYGSTEQSRASRAQVVAQLNSLAGQLGANFNDLCQRPQPAPQHNYNGGSASQVNQQNGGLPLSSSQRSKAYIGFSSQDKRYLDELHIHLNQYVQKGTIDYWDNTKILPGANWRKETEKALDSAKVAILLVSADFLSSDLITKVQLPVLLKAASDEGTVILCVILRPCAFQDSDLEQFRPVNTQPLSKMSQDGREEVWNNLAMQVRHILRASS